MEQDVEEVWAEDERRMVAASGGLSAADRAKEQESVWGDGPDWGHTVDRLRYYDHVLQLDVCRAIECKDAEGAITAVLETMFPKAMEEMIPQPRATPEVEARVLERLARIRPLLVESLNELIENGRAQAWPHLTAQQICNAVLRGFV